VYDWKTGKIYPKHREQAALYALLTFALYPEIPETTVHFVYLDQNKSVPYYFRRESAQLERDRVVEKIKQIERAVEHDMFPAQPQFLCRYCNFSRANKGPCAF